MTVKGKAAVANLLHLWRHLDLPLYRNFIMFCAAAKLGRSVLRMLGEFLFSTADICESFLEWRPGSDLVRDFWVKDSI